MCQPKTNPNLITLFAYEGYENKYTPNHRHTNRVGSLSIYGDFKQTKREEEYGHGHFMLEQNLLVVVNEKRYSNKLARSPKQVGRL